MSRKTSKEASQRKLEALETRAMIREETHLSNSLDFSNQSGRVRREEVSNEILREKAKRVSRVSSSFETKTRPVRV